MLACVLCLLALPLSPVSPQFDGDPPAEIERFVPSGFAVLAFATADLNGDGRVDAVVILKKDEEDDFASDGVPRPLLLLIRQANGQLKQERRYDQTIPCRTCCRHDPFQGMTASRTGFTVNVQCDDRTSSQADGYTFAWDAGKRDWFLEREEHHLVDDDGPIDDTFSITRDELGDVRLEGFEAGGHRWEPLGKWQVVAARSYFYQNPDLRSSPRKAYVVKDDLVQGREFRNFVEAFHENGRGRTTHGFLLKKDLQPAAPKPNRY